MKTIVAAALVVAGLLAQPISTASSQGETCRFVLGFAALREQVGADKVGRCLEDERFNAGNGNAEQRTSGGLMVWRKVDNFTAFTDGATSWIAGPEGLQSRPNGERFAWEKDPIQPTSPTAARPAASPGPAPAPAAASASTPTVASPDRAIASPAVGGTTSSSGAPVASPAAGSTSPTGSGGAGQAAGPVGPRDPSAGVPPVNPTTCPADQPIKGNQGSREGDSWIYHTPLSPAYRATQPARCFATSAAAEAAGYRAPER